MWEAETHHDYDDRSRIATEQKISISLFQFFNVTCWVQTLLHWEYVTRCRVFGNPLNPCCTELQLVYPSPLVISLTSKKGRENPTTKKKNAPSQQHPSLTMRTCRQSRVHVRTSAHPLVFASFFSLPRRKKTTVRSSYHTRHLFWFVPPVHRCTCASLAGTLRAKYTLQ